jgi:hypothetical protein
MENEEILLTTTGLASVMRMGQRSARQGTIFVTNHRVGVFTKKLGGHDLTYFAFGLLTSVEYKKGLTMGDVTLLAAGSRMRVRQIDKTEVENVAKVIRDRMAIAHSPQQ